MLQVVLRLVIYTALFPLRIVNHLLRNPRYDEKYGFASFELQRQSPDIPETSTLPAFTVNVVSSGGGFSSSSKRLLVESSGTGGGNVSQQDAYTVAAGGGSGDLKLGYVIRPGQRLRVYPFAGIGGFGQSAVITKTPQPLNRDSLRDALKDPAFKEGHGGMMVTTGLGIDYRIGWRYGLIIGLRVGTINGLGIDYSAPFVQLILGIGRLHKRSPKMTETDAESG